MVDNREPKPKEFIGHSLSIAIPDGFHVMDSQELQQVFLSYDPNRWGIWNKETHVRVTVLWKDYPLLLSKLADLKTVCRKNEQMTAKGYAGHNYLCGRFFSVTVAGQSAEGYSFTYSIDDIRQSAETVLIKKGKTIYSITCVGRVENKTADHEAFTEMLKTVR